MVDFAAARGIIELVAKDTRFQKAMTKARAALAKVRESMISVSQKAKIMLLAAGGAIVGFVKASSDFEETASKFRTVFKYEADAAEEWADTNSKAMNRSKVAMMGFLAAMQDTFVPFGVARDEARLLSQQVTALAVDLASFNNMADDEALMALQSALVGNHETVRRFGVIINEQILNLKLMEMGIKGGTKAATEQQKIMARLAIIVQGTSDAQGDAVRTSQSFANQWKGLKADALDFATAMGDAIIPMIRDMVAALREVSGPVIEWVKENNELVLSLTKWSVGALVVLAILPKIVAGVTAIVTVIGAMKTAVLALIPVITAAKAGMIALAANPVALGIAAITAAVAGLVVGLVALWRWVKKAEEKVRDAEQASKDMASAMTDLKKANKELEEAEDPEAKMAALQKVKVANMELLELSKAQAEQYREQGDEYADLLRAEENAMARWQRNIDKTDEAMKAVTEEIKERERLARDGKLSKEEQKIAQEAEKALEKLKVQLATLGMGKREAEDYALAAKGYTDEQREQIRNLKEQIDAEQKRLDLVEDQKEKAKEAKETAAERIKSLKREIALLEGASADQFELVDLEKLGVAKEKIEEIRELLERRKELEMGKELEAEAETLRKSLRTEKEIAAEERERVEKLKEAGKIDEETYRRAVKRISERAKERENERRASFEGLTSLFRRIQSAAATQRRDKAAEETMANTGLTAKATNDLRDIMRRHYEVTQRIGENIAGLPNNNVAARFS